MIKLQDIHKSYNGNHAVTGISLHIKEGEFYSLLGPNGAGKTTTIHIISTLFPPDKGSVFINGKNTASDPVSVKKQIGVVPQEISLYEELSALDNLLFFGSLYDISRKELKERADVLLQDFGLTERKNDRIAAFSGGMKRRINIAVALMHHPQIIIMDEPTVGIDPQSRNNIYDAIQKIKNKGISILYTTHYMEEAERFSDRIGIIDKGSIIAEGTLDELLSKTQISSSIHIKATSFSDGQKNRFGNAWNYISEENSLIFSSVNMRTDLPAILNDLFAAGIEIQDIDIHRAGLETVFLSLTGKNLRD